MTDHGVAVRLLLGSPLFVLPGGIRLAVHIVWRRRGRHGLVWWLKECPSLESEYVLLVRMEESGTALDFLLLTRQHYVFHPLWFTEPGADAVRICTAGGLVAAIRALGPPPRYERTFRTATDGYAT